MHRRRHELAVSARRPWLKEGFPRRFNAWRATLTPTPRSGCNPALHTILLPLTGMSMLTTNGDVAAVLVATNAIATSFAPSKMVFWVRDIWAKIRGTKAILNTPGTRCRRVLQGPLRSWSFSATEHLMCWCVRRRQRTVPYRLYSRVDVWNLLDSTLSTHPVPADAFLPRFRPWHESVGVESLISRAASGAV